jgi:uncharacterized protein
MPELPPDLTRLSLDEMAAMIDGQSRPPLEKWQPPFAGTSHIRIARDGRWYHRGDLIERENLVRLFATILRREEDGRFMLVTPVEKQEVEVEDAPFIAVEVRVDGAGDATRLTFRLNTGEIVVAGPDHPLTVRGPVEEPAPYLAVRDGLEARLARPVFYELAEIALTADSESPVLRSDGAVFPLLVQS